MVILKRDIIHHLSYKYTFYDNYSWNGEKVKKWAFLSKKCSFCKQIAPFVSKKASTLAL